MIEILPVKKPVKISTDIPGSKSYTNRALLLASLAEGKSVIDKPLFSDDTEVMIKALEDLGVKIKKRNSHIVITGKAGKFSKPTSPLSLGNAGTGVRFLTAALAFQDFESVVTGNKRMQERPIKDLTEGLKELGAQIETNNGNPPVKILSPINKRSAKIDGSASSQFISAILMAAPLSKEKITLKIKGKLTSLPYVKMTLDTMEDFGVKIKNKRNKKFIIKPQVYSSAEYEVEADASSATYPLAIAAITGGKTKIKNLGKHSLQADILFTDVLKKMGCRVRKTSSHITVKGPRTLKPLGNIDLNDLPDAAMTVAIVCAFAKGKSVLKNIYNLRLKETDRLKALATELRKIGIKAEEKNSSLTVYGNPDEIHAAEINTYNDHRIAMCFSVAGAKIPGIKILNPKCVSKTYPAFYEDLKSWGIDWKTYKPNKDNIILCGLRGSGKSLIGRTLAKKLDYELVDTDKLIEEKCGMKIAQIVKEKGWKYFRKKETETCKSLKNRKKTIIATGGGMLMNPANAEILKKMGTVFLLKEDPAVLAKRIKNDENRPPLTHHRSLKAEMEQLWKDRRANYFEHADFVIRTDKHPGTKEKDAELKSNQIITLLKSHD